MNNFDYKNMTPFKWFVLENFPFIENDFDAINNYHLFSKVVEYLNKTIDNMNLTGEQMENVTNAMTELQNYVNNYFENLDVQEEINNKLDEMVESGELEEIISDYLNSKAVFGYNNVEEMTEASNLINGSYAKTMGYFQPNDMGSALYRIRTITNSDVVDGGNIIALNKPHLIAELIVNDYVNPEMFGAKGDGVTDDTNSIINMFKAKASFYIFNKIYKITQEINISNIPYGSTLKGGILYPTSNPNGVRRPLFSINNRTDKITIKTMKIKSDNDQIPYMPANHTRRENSFSSNIMAFNINKSENIYINNINFENMGYDAHIQGLQYDGTFGCRNIFFNDCVDNGGQMGIYADSIDNLNVNNYTMFPAEIGAGGYHIIYVAEGIGKARLNNISILGNETTDVAFDFAGFNNREDINYNADIVVDGFNIKANALCAIKRNCKNIQLLNGNFVQLDKIREDGVRQSGTSLALYHQENDNNEVVFPTIKSKNVEFKNGTSNQFPGYLCPAFEVDFGKYIFENCTIDDMPVQDSDLQYRGQVEFYKCTLIDRSGRGIYRTFRARTYDNLTSYGIFEFCNIIGGGVYPFNTRKDSSYSLKLKNNIITNTSNVAIAFNGDDTSGKIEASGNDYTGTNISSSTYAFSGMSNTDLVQYNNYVGGQLYT